jgi:glutathione S-transferase
MALAVARVNPEHREVVLRHKPPQMLALSTKGTVPVLQTSEGVVFDESLDIMRYALSLEDPQGWLRHEDCTERSALVEFNDGPFKAALDRYKYASGEDPEVVASSMEVAADMLQRTDRAMTGHPYLDGQTMGFFDAAIFPFIRQFAGVDRVRFEGIAPLGVTAWLDAMLASAEFKQIMAKVARWSAGDQPLGFLDTLVDHERSG